MSYVFKQALLIDPFSGSWWDGMGLLLSAQRDSPKMVVVESSLRAAQSSLLDGGGL
jgi:hypothetical protein